MTDKLTISDVRNAGYCPSGAKRWWEDQKVRLPSFRSFLTDGLDMEIATQIPDAYARRACAVARERINAERNNGQ